MDPNDEQRREFIRAIVNGDTATVRTMLNRNNRLLDLTPDGRTPLLRAAGIGHERIVKLLLEAGADVNKADNNGNTPLYAAVYFGHERIVKLLLDSGADINKANKFGNTPLMEAAAGGHKRIVKLLLDSGADINKAYNNGWTPLFTAAREDNIEIVKLLLDSGADKNKADINGNTPLMGAAYEGYDRIVKFLLEAGAGKDNVSKGGWTALTNATVKGHIEIVKLLLDSGADINAGDIKNKLHVIEYFYDNPEIFSDQQYNRIIRENFRPMDPKKMCEENNDGEYVDFISYEKITSTSSSPSKQNRLLLWARVPRNPEASLNKIIYDCFTLDTFMGIGKSGFKHPMTRKKIAEDKVGIYYVDPAAVKSAATKIQAVVRGHQTRSRIVRSRTNARTRTSSSSRTNTNSRFGKGKSKSKSNGKKPQKRPSSAVCTRAQKLGIRLTLKRNNKRVYKSEEMLRKQIKNAVNRQNRKK
jgi:ankyrin repeat protein